MSETRLIDGRDMLPPEPLELALVELNRLEPGEELVMRLHCEPLPLYAILDRGGFHHDAVRCADGSLEIHIKKS